ncbi:unnamed protein product [Colias eurytheme]|nr:unnamed protein product [Colias eurytheme]
MNFIALLVGLLVFYIVFRYKRRRLYQLASRIPEPPDINSFLGLLQFSFDAQNVMMRVITDYTPFCHMNGGHAKLWLGPKLYIYMTNLEDSQFVLKNCLEKDEIMLMIEPCLGKATVIAPVPIWEKRRKATVSAFTPKNINNFVNTVSKQSLRIVEQMSSANFAGTGVFSLWPYINRYSLKSSAEAIFGVEIENAKRPLEVYLEAITVGFQLCTYRMMHFWLWPDFIYNLTSQGKIFYDYVDIAHETIDEIIAQTRANLEKKERNNNNSIDQATKIQPSSFLEHLLLLDNNVLSSKDIREETLVLLIAATDSSAIAICNTLLLLAKYPKIQEKVYDEIKAAFGDSDRLLNTDDLHKITYLGAVLKESLRLFPPVPMVARKPDSEIKLPSGIILPPETGVLVSIYGINRDPASWGPDADCFIPERHLEDTENGPTTIPFSAGPRNCLGYQYALMSVKISLIAILRRFKIVGEEESDPAPTMECDFTLMMKAKDGYRVALEYR